MEESKYYTPKIEEFYVGFEYEHFQCKLNSLWEEEIKKGTKKYTDGDLHYCHDNDQYWEYRKFIKKTLDINTSLYTINFNIKQKYTPLNIESCIRVKCLDQQDIEELGWVHKNNAAHGYHEFKGKYCQKENFVWYELLWIEPISHIEIYTRKVQDRKAAFHDIGDFFRGTIKNKSELKKLMEQLGI